MRVTTNTCPRCNELLLASNAAGAVVTCRCGWHSSLNTQIGHVAVERRVSFNLLIISALFVGAFFHVITWDNHSIKIVAPMLRSMASVATVDDYNIISEVCKERGKLDCMEKSFQGAYKSDNNNIDALGELARTQLKLKKPNLASRNFKAYFRQGGENLRVAYEYAKLLGENGRVMESIKYFELVIQAKPDVLQVTVTKAYVDMLMKNNQYKKAKKLINHYRKHGLNAKYFMQNELQSIDRQIASQG